ncbi:hypothetical protein [Nonomuraea dietziae]|uniref:hypothetical protein n=1 Tax=Nonomuraea dietziae TaxID=65515 RepID=UPI0033ECE2CB
MARAARARPTVAEVAWDVDRAAQSQTPTEIARAARARSTVAEVAWDVDRAAQSQTPTEAVVG